MEPWSAPERLDFFPVFVCSPPLASHWDKSSVNKMIFCWSAPRSLSGWRVYWRTWAVSRQADKGSPPGQALLLSPLTCPSQSLTVDQCISLNRLTTENFKHHNLHRRVCRTWLDVIPWQTFPTTTCFWSWTLTEPPGDDFCNENRESENTTVESEIDEMEIILTFILQFFWHLR